MTTMNENSLRKILVKVCCQTLTYQRRCLQSVLRDLGNVFLCTQIYKYRDLTARDLNVTSHYKDLKPVLDHYGKT